MAISLTELRERSPKMKFKASTQEEKEYEGEEGEEVTVEIVEGNDSLVDMAQDLAEAVDRLDDVYILLMALKGVKMEKRLKFRVEEMEASVGEFLEEFLKREVEEG